MRIVTYLSLFVASLLAGWLLLGGGAAAGAPGAPDHVVLTWTADPATTITITWRAPAEAAAGVVCYQEGETLTATPQQALATATDLATDAGVWRLYSATLTGLAPKTRYAYRVGDGRQWSPVRAFTTADPEAESLTFLVFGDSQSIAPYAQWRKTVQRAFAAHPDARFMVNVGDLVDTGKSAGHWHAWFAAAEGVCFPESVAFLRCAAVAEMPLAGDAADIAVVRKIIGEAVYTGEIFNRLISAAIHAVRIIDIAFLQPVVDAVLRRNPSSEKRRARRR
ncbi:MAG TPA: fibronectin type III domain-containing protein [Armatimonadota bacterium]|nr:fibronectin type III domain-containing protein [Armatimonadota bacterium]